MNSAVKKKKKRRKEQRRREREKENKHPRHSTSVGSSCCSQVHLPADETWLIAVAIPARRPALARTWHSGFYLTVSSSASFIFIHPRLSPLLVVLHLLLCFLPPVALSSFFFYRLLLLPLTTGFCSYFPRACSPPLLLRRPSSVSLPLFLSFSLQSRLFNRVRGRICI